MYVTEGGLFHKKISITRARKTYNIKMPFRAKKIHSSSESISEVKITQSCPTLCNPIQSMEFARPVYRSG